MNLMSRKNIVGSGRRNVPLSVKIGIVFGGLVLTAAAAFAAVFLIRNYIAVHTPVYGIPSPRVTIAGKLYSLPGNGVLYVGSLPDEYQVIGQVMSERMPGDIQKEGSAVWFKVGEKVYQDPADPSEAYVYTKSFVNNGEYHYLRLTDDEWRRWNESGGVNL